MIAPAFTPSAWHVLAMQPSSPNELTAERWYAAICRPQVHSGKTPATALTSTATQSDETPATALTSTAYQSDETYSSELAMINGKPGSLYQRHERNASAASSEQVIASSTEWRPWRAFFAAQRLVSFSTSGRGDLSRLRLNVPTSNVPILVVDLALPTSPCPHSAGVVLRRYHHLHHGGFRRCSYGR